MSIFRKGISIGIEFFFRIYGIQVEGFKLEIGFLVYEVVWVFEGDVQGEVSLFVLSLYYFYCVILVLVVQNRVRRSVVLIWSFEICERCEMCIIFLVYIFFLVFQEFSEQILVVKMCFLGYIYNRVI